MLSAGVLLSFVSVIIAPQYVLTLANVVMLLFFISGLVIP